MLKTRARHFETRMLLAYNTPHSRVGLLRVNIFDVLCHWSLNGNFLCGACEGRGIGEGKNEKMGFGQCDFINIC